jgi:hypothetical protein
MKRAPSGENSASLSLAAVFQWLSASAAPNPPPVARARNRSSMRARPPRDEEK